MRLVLWDIDGTLVHTAGHGRDAFSAAFAAIFGRPADLTAVSMGGRTDHDIATEVLATGGVADGAAHIPRMLDELGLALGAVRERIAEEGHVTPGAPETLEAVGGQPGITTVESTTTEFAAKASASSSCSTSGSGTSASMTRRP